MQTKAENPLVDAYAFLVRGLGYRAKEILSIAGQDPKLPAGLRTAVQDALFIFVNEGHEKAREHLDAVMSSHERMKATEKAKEIRL